MNEIKFSQSGWNSLISDNFTFENIRIVTQAICNYFRKTQNYIDNFPPRLSIGFDSRFMGSRYADIVSEVVTKNGFDAFLSDRPSTTQALFWSVKTLTLTGGIMITAGDLPYEYSGMKVCNTQGSILRDKITAEIEADIETIKQEGIPDLPITPGEITEFNPRHYYFHQIGNSVNLSKIGKAGIDITVDTFNGAASNYVRDLLINYDCMVRELNNKVSSHDFMGFTPNLNKKNLFNLQQTVISPRSSLQAGFAIDGDGGKMKAIDISGSILSDEAIFCIILKHLFENKGIKKGIVKPSSEGKLIDKLCARYSLPVIDSKVKDGRNISEAIRSNDCIMGSTLDGDYHINLNHILEKDGVLATLLVLEAMAHYKQNLNSLYNQICQEVE
ncbi:MAG: hypothetical protein U0457_14885 [Candidatus Sericytochromatia bacterium]